MGNILIIAEHTNGKLRGATLNAVTFAREMAEKQGGGDVLGLVIGGSPAGVAGELANFVGKVLTVEDAGLNEYMAETWASVVCNVAKANDVGVIAATATAFGKDLLPRVAALLDCGMAAEIATVEGPKTFLRPMVAGNALGRIEVATDTVVVTLRQTEFAAAEPAGAGAVEAAAAGDYNSAGAEIVRIDAVTSARPDLAEAKVVIAGGRGMKNAENFKQLEKLADMFTGAIGATRAACDAGMVPNDLQVGQTGKVVAPDLYIAVGISGAIQHLAGMKGSKVIVAINKDEEAPIFQVADYGLVAKWEDTLEELTAKMGAAKS